MEFISVFYPNRFSIFSPIAIRQCLCLANALLIPSGFMAEPALAQIIPDNSLGNENSVVVPNREMQELDSDRIEDGVIRGSNLFHSFQEFNVDAERGAYFRNPSAIVAQTSDTTGEIPWQFSFEPYIYAPFGVNGDVTVGGIEVPINADFGDILDLAINTLNFVAFGRVEAWKGHWGIVFDGSYANLGTGQTVEIPVPSGLQFFGLPPQIDIDAAVGVSFSRFDLAAAYRFGDGNLPKALRTADTEFDLGAFLFDAIAGLRFQAFTTDLVLTSNLGDEFDFSDSQTFLEPMLGGQARWNLSDNFAVLAGGSISGFGIGDLTFSVDGYGA